MPGGGGNGPALPKCGANRTGRNGTCQLPAGQGTEHVGFGHCKFHGGTTPSGKAHAVKQMYAKQLGITTPLEMSPDAALLAMVHSAAGAVEWLRLKIAEAGEDELLDKDEWGELRPSVWYKLWASERDRLARISKMALDAGVAERQVQIAEQQASLMAAAIRQILDRLELSDDQASSAPAIVAAVMRALPAGEAA
jgi:hypothetical protein